MPRSDWPLRAVLRASTPRGWPLLLVWGIKMRQGESDGAHSSWSTFQNYKTRELRFRALLTQGGAKRLELVRA